MTTSPAEQMRFPSGKTISQVRKDAKRLKKCTPNQTLTQALDAVARKNGSFDCWAQAMQVLKHPIWKFEPYRNLMVLATNYLVENKLIGLQLPHNYYERRLKSTEVVEKGHVIVKLAGRNTIINWHDIGYGEIRISVWWDYEHLNHPQANFEPPYKEQFHTRMPLAKRSRFKDFVGVTCTVDLERKDGTYLMGYGREKLNSIYTRRGAFDALNQIPHTQPNGYDAEGKFRL